MQKVPCTIHNLAELKRQIVPGAEMITLSHAYHPNMIGLVRVVNEVHTNCFYSFIKDQPEHPRSRCNDGKGFRTDFAKASEYEFDGDTIRVLNPRTKDGSILMEFQVYPPEQKQTIAFPEDRHTPDIPDGKQTEYLNAPDEDESMPKKLETGDIISVIVYSQKDGFAFTPGELQYVKVITATTSSGVDKADRTDNTQLVTVTLLVNQAQAELLAQYEKAASMHFALEYRGDAATAQKYLQRQNEYFEQKGE